MESKHSRRTLFKSNRAIISSAKLSCIMQTEQKKETHCKSMPKQLKTWQQQEVNEAELPLLLMEDPVGYCKLLTQGEQRMTFEMWFVCLVLLSAFCNKITRKKNYAFCIVLLLWRSCSQVWSHNSWALQNSKVAGRIGNRSFRYKLFRHELKQ